MSRGPGKMQKLIMDALRESSVPMSAADLQRLRRLKLLAQWNPETDPDFHIWNTAARQRSLRMSMDRALRGLKANGAIKRDQDGNWYPAKDWIGRDASERHRASIAYHEAGHAVIGLALKMPVAFVTIKPRKNYLGHVSQAPIRHSVGQVYARGSYWFDEPIADMAKEDAFGNPASQRNDDWHADAVMSIAGGMAEAEFLKDGRTWSQLDGTSGDRRSVAYARRKLGNKARSVREYAAECETLIKQHWPMIEAVAAKLLKEETLSGNDVYSICWRTIRNVVRQQHLKTKQKAAA
jgi:peptidase M41-like protein